METIVICSECANFLHLIMAVSFGLCFQMACHSCGLMCFMELCLGRGVYVSILCICMRPRFGVIENAVS